MQAIQINRLTRRQRPGFLAALRATPFRRLGRCQRAITAVEFALVAPVFIATVIASLQTAVIFFAQENLQTAVNESARLIMTGQAQKQGMTAGQFQSNLCTHLISMFNCSGVYVNTQTFTSFSTISMTNPVQNNNFQSSGLTYSPGGPGDIVVVQGFYQWPVVFAPLAFYLSNVGGNKRLLTATAAFRNEPYI